MWSKKKMCLKFLDIFFYKFEGNFKKIDEGGKMLKFY